MRGATPSPCDSRCGAGYFNPRAPCGARLSARALSSSEANFNPRAPCGARLPLNVFLCSLKKNFNPRAPCGARHPHLIYCGFTLIISIHAPRAGRDEVQICLRYEDYLFQSTRPVRGATIGDYDPPVVQYISIHAPRAGRDHKILHKTGKLNYFNPRAPCGARLYVVFVASFCLYFNPRAPCGARPGCNSPERLTY